MKIKAETLLNNLAEQTGKHLSQADKLNQQSDEKLHWKPAPDSWCALECIEHLNLYGDLYLPEIEKRLNESSYPPEKYFRGGLVGNIFAKTMLPKENMMKMNTFSNMKPENDELSKSVLRRFSGQQKQMLVLLEESRDVSLNRTRVPISIAKWVKLKLGDILRVVIYHNERHLVQAEGVVKAFE